MPKQGGQHSRYPTHQRPEEGKPLAPRRVTVDAPNLPLNSGHMGTCVMSHCTFHWPKLSITKLHGSSARRDAALWKDEPGCHVLVLLTVHFNCSERFVRRGCAKSVSITNERTAHFHRAHTVYIRLTDRIESWLRWSDIIEW